MNTTSRFAALAFGLIMALGTFSVAGAGTPKDGRYYFDQMKESIIKVLAENQKLINTNPDGSVKSKKLEPEAVYRESYQTFKTVMGKDFEMKDLDGQTDPEKIAHALTSLLQASRDTIAKLQDDINKEADGSVKLKKFIPAVFGRLSLEAYQASTGVTMKQTTLGKGGYSVRNAYNTPTAWEQEALKKFEEPNWPLNQGFGVAAGNEYRYVKPLYIKKGCLPCHGFPVGENDPYGHPKEGYQEGEVRGGISVLLPIN